MAKNYEYKKATIADIDELVRTRIIVLRTANKLSNDVDLSLIHIWVSSCPCIIRTMVISSSRLQLFSSSSVCLSAIVPLLKLFLLYQKTQRIANRQPRRFRHSAYACMVV